MQGLFKEEINYANKCTKAHLKQIIPRDQVWGHLDAFEKMLYVLKILF